MAVTLDNSADVSPGGSSTSLPYTVGTGAAPIVILMDFEGSTANPATSVSYGGVAMTQAYYLGTSGTGQQSLAVWYLVNPPTGSHTFTCSGGSTGTFSGSTWAVSYFGVTGFVNVLPNSPNSTTTPPQSTNLTPVRANSWWGFVVSNQWASPTFSVGTQRLNTGSRYYFDSNGTAGAGTVTETASGTSSSQWYTSVMFEFEVWQMNTNSESTAVSDTPNIIITPLRFLASDSTAVSDSASIKQFGVAELVASMITSGYKWLTSTLTAAQQQFSARPYFTVQVIDDTTQPNAQLFSGTGTPLGQGSMVVAPDGTAFAMGLDGSNNLCVFSATDLNAAAGVWPTKVILNTTGDNFLDSRNIYSLQVSPWYNGKYRLTAWYYNNFVNDGTNLSIRLQYSDDGGTTWTKLNAFSTSGLPNNSIGNLALAAMTPTFDGTNLNFGVFYIKPNTNTFNFTGYDVYYLYGNTGGTSSDVKWGRNVNSSDWSIHSLGAYYLNGVQYLVFSGFRNVLDTVGANANYSLWVTSLLNITRSTSTDLWSAPVSAISAGTAGATNLNSFTYPTATVSGSMAYITYQATVVDSVSQTSQGTTAQVVTTHTNYQMIQSENGKSFSYPAVMVGTDGTEFNSATYASFMPQASFWYLGGGLGWLWQYIQNNTTADVSADVIGYQIQETASQPSSVSVQIGNANGKWVGSSPTGTGAAAISRNKKLALWQGYYNASGATEAVPRNIFYIDDIQQNVTGTTNDVTITGRDWFKKIKNTVTKFTYQYIGPLLFSDIFDGTFYSSWNQVSGTWSFLNTISPPELEVTTTSGGEDKIMLVGGNGSSYGHLMRVFFRSSGAGNVYIYGMYIDANNWLRLEINCADGQSWAVKNSINGSVGTLDSGTMPFTMVNGQAYGVFVRRYNYFTFNFMIANGADSVGNSLVTYSPATTSYLFANIGVGDYDLSNTVDINASMQASFTVGFGRDVTGPTIFRWFTFAQYNTPTDLGSIMRRIARIAGIFSFKLSYTWRELLFQPSFTGTPNIKNREIILTSNASTLSNNNSFADGEISFMAKIKPESTSSQAGFSFNFRHVPVDINGQPGQYNFHIMQAGTGLINPPVFCRFERYSAGLSNTYRFYNSPADVSNNATNLGSINLDLTKWHTYRIVMVGGWFYAFVDDVMVAAANDNNTIADYITSGQWGFTADPQTTVTVQKILAPNFWKPVQTFSYNPGDDAESALDSLIQSLRAWYFSDILGRFKAVFLGTTDTSTYTYNTQLYQQQVDQSDKEYVAQVTVLGNGVSATARNTSLMAGVPTRDMIVVDYSISTQADAQTRANNELTNASQYLNQYTPKQFINVGSELFDAVTVVNTGNNTTGINSTTRVYAESFNNGGGTNNTDYSLEVQTGDL